jgi:hypothetical protein
MNIIINKKLEVSIKLQNDDAMRESYKFIKFYKQNK